MKKQIKFNEINLEKLKADLNEKNKMEKNLIGDSENLNEKLFELSKNLGSKIDEINILNQKYKILQEKTVSDSFKMHTLEEDINFHKAQISSLNKDIDAKNIEIRKDVKISRVFIFNVRFYCNALHQEQRLQVTNKVLKKISPPTFSFQKKTFFRQKNQMAAAARSKNGGRRISTSSNLSVVDIIKLWLAGLLGLARV